VDEKNGSGCQGEQQQQQQQLRMLTLLLLAAAGMSLMMSQNLHSPLPQPLFQPKSFGGKPLA